MSRYKGPSEAQINADALNRRDSPYSVASEMSFSLRWDSHRREPADLREAVRMVRQAYSDEVPTKLHEGPGSIGEGGTPKMTARAEGYLFGRADSDDAPKGRCAGESTCREFQTHRASCVEHGGPEPCTCTWQHHETCPANPRNQAMLGYYHAPFRAKLAEMQRGDEGSRKRARIVAHVTIGSQGPMQAAQAEGVPRWCARIVAEDALRSFLRQLTDVKLHMRRQQEESEAAIAV